MSDTRASYRRNSPQAAAHVIATLIAHDARLDWRELDFLGNAGLLQILGIERERFMVLLAFCLDERLVDEAPTDNSDNASFDAALLAIEDRNTQLITAAALLYLAEIDGTKPAECTLIHRAWKQWNVTAEILVKEMNIPFALAHTVHEPISATA